MWVHSKFLSIMAGLQASVRPNRRSVSTVTTAGAHHACKHSFRVTQHTALMQALRLIWDERRLTASRRSQPHTTSSSAPSVVRRACVRPAQPQAVAIRRLITHRLIRHLHRWLLSMTDTCGSSRRRTARSHQQSERQRLGEPPQC